jgi:hypothetical protein
MIQSRIFTKLRDTLLPKLPSGELNVGAAPAFASEPATSTAAYGC